MKEASYPILYHLNLILGVFSHFAPDVIYKKLKSLRDFFKGSWTWLKLTVFPSQDSFCGLGAIKVLKRDNMLL